ncbi:MAG: CPBP family intramembrane metalloprotease [Clostridia bacterium]|nr:CPBP family intramembrane metalloprotease [Clostridia bacterium]
MDKLYQKNELTFAIIWIVIYVVAMSLADMFSAMIGIEKVLTAPIAIGISIFLIVWIIKKGLGEKYGLTKGKIDIVRYLFFIPLILMVSVNFWGGVALNFSPLETVLFVISMLGVGFMEEIIFRGFLFKALLKDNLKMAIIISSVTFGIGHVINLINGADLVPTLLQICYAIAGGFMFTIIFYKSGTLIPCIVAHSLINATSAFEGQTSLTLNIITAVVLTVVSVGYAIWLWKGIKTDDNQNIKV